MPLLDEIKTEMKKIAIRPLSWIGRINTLKMVILPKIMYEVQMLPIALPQTYFKVLKTMITTFIWQNKKSGSHFRC